MFRRLFDVLSGNPAVFLFALAPPAFNQAQFVLDGQCGIDLLACLCLRPFLGPWISWAFSLVGVKTLSSQQSCDCFMGRALIFAWHNHLLALWRLENYVKTIVFSLASMKVIFWASFLLVPFLLVGSGRDIRLV